MMANWLGGTFVNRDHKGDPGEPQASRPKVPGGRSSGRPSTYVIENAFYDEAFGLDNGASRAT